MLRISPPKPEKQVVHKIESTIKNHPAPSLKILNANRERPNGPWDKTHAAGRLGTTSIWRPATPTIGGVTTRSNPGIDDVARAAT